ncbi:response regulator receiver protein [Pseudomonas taeanensis MS-3]|jgi:DNA-binding NtrC family response regulator|uniref:Response regulator receiver protein n=1 Tax=Pseudomonas taeanensis MS-3 TaxID=1395571 RepID=A0A0A1YJS1_9PSED|nr:response regulator [Pseudomonas taeanensis]KFX69213.1 response regulator receiver protein [Pseudomonas taeanensis MS-3]
MMKIQLLDDEQHVLSALRRLLHPYDWEVHVFSDAQLALQALTEHEYAVIVSDLKMPEVDGITYLQFARQRQPNALRILLSAHGDRQSMLQAINQAEIYRFISKPWADFEVETALRTAIDLFLLRDENQRLLLQLRQQQSDLERQEQELLRLEAEYPGITRVHRDNDGSVLIDEIDDSF